MSRDANDIGGWKATALPIAGALVSALACAAALDAMGIRSLGFHRGAWLVASPLLGALHALAWPALVARARLSGARARSSEPPWRRALVGAVVAGLAAFVVGRTPLGWVDLGALGAGTPGELPLFVVPFVSLLAVVAVLPRRAARSAR